MDMEAPLTKLRRIRLEVVREASNKFGIPPLLNNWTQDDFSIDPEYYGFVLQRFSEKVLAAGVA